MADGALDQRGELGPLVSIIIPCFNHAPFVASAVRSALQSTHENVEVIVRDDGSTDDPSTALSDFRKDRRLRILHGDHVGSNRARCLAINASNGEFIAFLDADDTMSPERIEKQLALAQFGDQRRLVFCGSHVFHRGALRSIKAPNVKAGEPDVTNAYIAMKYRPNSATLLISRAFYEEIGGFDPAYRHLETHLHLRALAARGRVLSAPDILYQVRRDGHSLSTRSHGDDMVRFIKEVDAAYAAPDADRSIRKYCRMRQRLNAIYLWHCPKHEREIVLRALRRARLSLADRFGIEMINAIACIRGSRWTVRSA